MTEKNPELEVSNLSNMKSFNIAEDVDTAVYASYQSAKIGQRVNYPSMTLTRH